MAKTNYVKVKNKQGIIFHQSDVVLEEFEILKPGLYQVYDQGGMFQTLYTFEAIELKDSLIKFRTGIVSDILKKTQHFFSADTTQAYKDLAINQKMGILMYGPPGTGKTCTAQLIMSELVERYGAICLDGTGRTLSFILQCVQKVRSVQDNPIVVFQDEAEQRMRADEDEYLTFLDGNDSVHRCIFLGCTNYLDKVPKRIRERRSRIKHVFEVKALPLDVYAEYVRSKLPMMAEKVILEFAYKAEDSGLTIDELKHAVVDYHIEKLSIDEAIENVKTYSIQEKWDD